jgi:two-component system chemotaxis response regulator CheY
MENSSERNMAAYPGTMPPKYSMRLERDAPFTREQHVLIIDDDPFFRSLLRVLLGQTGWPITAIWEAEDSHTALKICRTEPVDLVFCDLNLANLQSDNGLQVIRELRLTHPQIPLFMVTADSGDAVIEQAFAAGATGHLLKPITLHTLRGISSC